jgi:hypothetical protein
VSQFRWCLVFLARLTLRPVLPVQPSPVAALALAAVSIAYASAFQRLSLGDRLERDYTECVVVVAAVEPKTLARLPRPRSARTASQCLAHSYLVPHTLRHARAQ